MPAKSGDGQPTDPIIMMDHGGLAARTWGQLILNPQQCESVRQLHSYSASCTGPRVSPAARGHTFRSRRVETVTDAQAAQAYCLSNASSFLRPCAASASRPRPCACSTAICRRCPSPATNACRSSERTATVGSCCKSAGTAGAPPRCGAGGGAGLPSEGTPLPPGAFAGCGCCLPPPSRGCACACWRAPETFRPELFGAAPLVPRVFPLRTFRACSCG